MKKISGQESVTRQRGRKSSLSLPVVSSLITVDVPRQQPPSRLGFDELLEWRAIVDAMPADWFSRENQALLEHYCVHVCRSHRIMQVIRKFEEDKTFDFADYDRLLDMLRKQSGIITTLATKMRLAQQSTIPVEVRKSGTLRKKPWES